jgi:hypothetical protein
MAYKGKYKPKNYNKYIGNADKITFRSLWEYKFMKYCDSHPSILKWCSEEVIIPYTSPIDGKKHRYFVDFLIQVKTLDDEIKNILIEVKPKAQTQEPKKKKTKSKRYLKEVETYCINRAKWTTAEKYCKKRNWDFKILTENELFK